jgi:hypothetical protein
LDKIEGRQPAVDGPFPEDWIGSTINVRNPNPSRPGEGLARAAIEGQETLLTDLIVSDPEYFLATLPLFSSFRADSRFSSGCLV